jgi:NAD(P)H-dependent flavin oxidoreductase YrpB (nitropropane dioxygenase family)
VTSAGGVRTLPRVLRTRFTALVGCEVPLQLAPMGPVCTPDLVGAVTAAGAMGMTSMPGAPAPAVDAALDAFVAAARGPFGYNVLLPFLDRDVVDVVVQRCRVVDFYHGAVDAALVDQVHAGGALAGWQVTSIEDARVAADAGCDLLVVRGTEGGGRMHGTRSLWPLLDDVLDAVDVPVLAAGGIASARGVAAALAAGADGVRLGTRFVATVESGAHQRYKQALVDARSGETVLTDRFDVLWPDPVKSARVLQRAVDTAAGAGDVVGTIALGPDTVDVPRFAVMPPTAQAEGNIEAMAMYAGDGVGAIDAIEPAADIVRALAGGTEARLRRLRDELHE